MSEFEEITRNTDPAGSSGAPVVSNDLRLFAARTENDAPTEARPGPCSAA